ncbi:hypothetical protein ACFL02_09280 [Planctomycetota bacterium]
MVKPNYQAEYNAWATDYLETSDRVILDLVHSEADARRKLETVVNYVTIINEHIGKARLREAVRDCSDLDSLLGND